MNSSKLITPESPLLVPPLLAAEIGLYEALILQQIHYYCQISKHIKADGRRWFWKTLQDWGETLPFLKLSTIRRAIANLRNFQLIDVCRHSQKTWYQANWFTVNVENVEALWNRICQNQQMEAIAHDELNCSNLADDIKEFPTQEFASQQHPVAELEKTTEEEEVQHAPRYVVIQEESDSLGDTDSHEDSFFPPPEATQKPTSQEVQQVLKELREIPCSKGFKLNREIQQAVVRYWANVPSAIAYLKQALKTWKRVDSPEAVFVAACKEARKPEGSTISSDVKTWFEWARKERIIIAMSGDVAYLVDGSAVSLKQIMQLHPMP